MNNRMSLKFKPTSRDVQTLDQIGRKYKCNSYCKYFSACSVRSLADALASMKRSATSSTSTLRMASLPLVLATMEEGVSSCTAWRREVRSPTSPSLARHSGSTVRPWQYEGQAAASKAGGR